MANKSGANEPDAIYVLKILLYLVLGVIWIKINGRPVIPLGLIVGLLFARQEHFRIDRRVEYLVLIVAAFVGLSGSGLFFTLGGY